MNPVVLAARAARAALAVAAAVVAAVATPAAARQAVNPIHPAFVPLGADGRPVREAGTLSPERTCGACHDATYVAAHTGHGAGRARATCVECHVDGGRLDVRPETLEGDGRLRREALRIGAPRAASCGACHGTVAEGAAPVALPADVEAAPLPGDRRSWSLTLGEGAIVSPQRMSDSFLNLADKAALGQPWDVHAAKLVDCVACHYASNDPRRSDAKRAPLPYVATDPRRPSTAEFLVRPDHRLGARDCRGCHDPLRAHAFLPYRQRHLDAVACESCHASGSPVPAAEMVDATVATREGTPRVRWRNVERRPGEALNAATVRPFLPLLVERAGADGIRRLSPLNTVARFRWVSGPARAEVPFERVRQAFHEGDGWAPAVLAAFDANRDGQLDDAELRLDTRAKTELVANRLRAMGVAEPAIEGTLDVYPVAHGVSTRDRAVKACEACHAKDAHLAQDAWVLATYLPGGTPPRPRDGARVALGGVLVNAPGGALVRAPAADARGGLHLFGRARRGPTSTLGFAVFVAVGAGVALHGLARVLLRRRRGGEPARAARAAPAAPQYLFGRYERVWHWTMALSGVVLIVSGLAVHGGARLRALPLPTAVALHNVFAVVLIVNGFLALFHHLTTLAIRNFIPHPEGLLRRVREHADYQARGIFRGASHPPNAPGHKLNPLQQLTYLALLNVLFPLQIATGALIWAVGQWRGVAGAVGGLSVVAPLHDLGAWLFLSFFVLHAYLVTTGRTPTDHLRSMITGFGHLEVEEPTP